MFVLIHTKKYQYVCRCKYKELNLQRNQSLSIMQIELLQRIISEGQQLIGRIQLVKRPAQYEDTGNYVFVGLRQVGKSYMLYARMQELISQGVSPQQLVYINFDDERIDLKAEELDQIIQAHRTMTDLEPLFFFDEIQNVEGWERFARRLANYKQRVYITGSNAKMLSREISTTLGGRYWTRLILPYSFSEYLRAVGFELPSNWQFGASDADIERYFKDYLYFGGLPEIVNVMTKRAWLNEMYSKILLSDIIVRNNLRSENAVRMIVRRLAESVMQPISINRLVGLVRSTGTTISNATLNDYIRYLRDSFLIFSVENYAAKFSERATVMKYYFTDNGLLNIFLRTPDTLLLENVVAVELCRRYGIGNFYFYRENIEIDFVIPEDNLAIQVAWSIDDGDTIEREKEAHNKFHKRYPGFNHLLITRYETNTKAILDDGTPVQIIPVWKWLLTTH